MAWPPSAGGRADPTVFLPLVLAWMVPSARPLIRLLLASSAAFLEDSESEKGYPGMLLAASVALAIHLALDVVVAMHRNHCCLVLYGAR